MGVLSGSSLKHQQPVSEDVRYMWNDYVCLRGLGTVELRVQTFK